MEPLDDRELGELLRTWEAPGAPSRLRVPRMGRAAIWAWLIRGQVRVPVPVVAAALLIVMLSLWWGVWERRTRTVSFAEFQPVKQLEPRVIRSNYENR